MNWRPTLHELSLFTGAGGGLLGTSLLGWRPVGYVEWDDYCQRIIAQRIKDGLLPEAPIFSDVRAFSSEGFAKSYQGLVDVVTAGFPCQPFSLAGKRKAENDERNMWPATMEVIKTVKPPFCFLENVPGLLSARVDDGPRGPVYYFGEILRDLAQAGFDARWCVLGADDVGAIHRRKRLWIYAWHTKSKHRFSAKPEITEHQGQQKPKPGNADQQVVTTNYNGIRLEGERAQQQTERSERSDVTNTQRQRIQRNKQKAFQRKSALPWGENLRSIEDIEKRPDIPEPLLRRMDDGMAHRVDRTKAIGNGQVPAVVAEAWRLLSSEICI